MHCRLPGLHVEKQAMTPDLHVAKAERIERSLERCSDEDFEAVIEGAMLAGTHWFNVAMHRFLLTNDTDDVMHAEYMTLAMQRKLSLVSKEMLDALEEIENYRPRFVRGDIAGGPACAVRCRTLLARIRKTAEEAAPFRNRIKA